MINWNTKPIAPPSARRLAYDVLYDVFVKEAYANLTLQKVMKKYSGKKYEPLSKPEKGLLTELVITKIVCPWVLSSRRHCQIS